MDLAEADWHKSSYSSDTGGNYVEMARNLPGVVAVRDSKDPDGPALTVTPDAWRGLLRTVQSRPTPA